MAICCYGKSFYFDENGRFDPTRYQRMKKEAEQKEAARKAVPHEEIEMPFIHGSDDGPIYISQDWYVKRKKKQYKKAAKETRIVKVEIMQLIAKRDRIMAKLASLDPSKKKDSKKIVNLNIKLNDINLEIDALQKEIGTDLSSLNHGSKWRRKWENFKKVVKKQFKKVRRWFKDNRELVIGIASVAIPAIITIILKLCHVPIPI